MTKAKESQNFSGEMNRETLLEAFVDHLEQRESLLKAAIGGLIGGLIALMLWYPFTLVKPPRSAAPFFLCAVVIGFGVRRCGLGIGNTFGILAASLTGLMILAGRWLEGFLMRARVPRQDLGDLVAAVNFPFAKNLLNEALDMRPEFALCTALSLYLAFRLGRYRLREDDLEVFRHQGGRL